MYQKSQIKLASGLGFCGSRGLGPGWQLVLAAAAATVILGAHAAALLVLEAPISAMKSLGAAES